MNLLLLSVDDATGDSIYTIADHRAEHIRSVLKRGVGESIVAGLLDGPIGDARVTAIDSGSVTLHFTATGPAPLPPLDIDLICAISRPQTMKKVLLTAGMMGLRQLHLVRANRTEKSYLDSPTLTPEKMRPLLLEGLAQGKFTRLPQVTIHPLFRPFAEDTWPSIEASQPTAASRIIFDVTTAATVADVWQEAPGQTVVAIGPEGGWVPFETEHFARLGFTTCCLGPWTLRVETAVTAALAQIELIRAMRASQH